MANSPAERFVFGLGGPELSIAERAFFTAHPPLGFLLFKRNLQSPSQVVELLEALRGIAPAAGAAGAPPLLFVDQEGGTVDRIGPLLGAKFASAAACSEAGTDRVHENAYLMGRAARLLGFDVDFAPCLDLGQPGAGAVVLEGRCFGFHAEDVVIGGMVFLHGLARAGLATCVKHFPGLGRGAVDSHAKLPVVDAHDVDLMVTDVAPFAKLARGADGVMVGHAAYPGFEDGAIVPASCSPRIHAILRGPVRFDGVVYSDDLEMSALEGTLPERAARAAEAGCDVLILSKTFEAYEEAVARVKALGADPARDARLTALRRRVAGAPRPRFTEEAWTKLGEEARAFADLMSKPREKRKDPFAF
ncbi:MAG TPA: glycoside hydrolase family 3 N-terminal domain-containing protein [Thermoanaerobaculia bacterium]|nr:glycoside hydrolase family 3 N-terminal domain-containing protein [Thermoanaerobaculia bacterium]